MPNPLKAGPNVSPAIAACIICMTLGGVAGYGARYWTESSGSRSTAPGSNGMGGGMGKMGGGMGKMGGGMGKMGGMGGGGGQPANPSRDLTNLMRRLATIEKVAGQELKPQQATKIAAVAEKIQSAKKLTDDDCKRETEAIEAVLTTEQRGALEALQPPGGGGGGMGKGGMMGGMGGMGKMGGMGGGKMMGGPGKSAPPYSAEAGGAPAAPDNPFSEGQNKERLDELVTLLKKKTG